jgi:hypothetical protein
MGTTEKYIFMRQAGFSHAEAVNYINKGLLPQGSLGFRHGWPAR